MPASAQYTIMQSSAAPTMVDSGDGNSVEVGVKFKADSSGSVTGLRFYKAKTNLGTHVGHIWSTTGVLLGSATFTSETASGWQQVNFSTPIPVTAGTIYVASYFAPEGHYSANENAFATAGIDSPPLHAMSNSADGGDGVYIYSSTPTAGGFPTSSYKSTNYWVDIVYTPQSTAGNPQLSIGGTSLYFGSVPVNSPKIKTVTLRSAGTSPVTISSAVIAGTGFSLVAGAYPVTLNPNKLLTIQIQFDPTAAAADTGHLTFTSNSTTNSTLVVTMTGTGTSSNPPQLTLSTTALNFGSEAVNAAETKAVTLTSTGASPVTVNSASISGADFTLVGGSFPVTLNQNQSVAVQLQFKPAAAGAATGQLAINSNSSTGSNAVVALSGTGTTVAHQVDLSWTAPASSPDPIAGYNIYRATGSAPSQMLNTSVDAQATYVDSSVASGTTYGYTVKSVDKSGIESTASNEFMVTIP